MPTPGTCANCGDPLKEEARKGFCPKCLFAQAQSGLFNFNMEGDFGDYELVEEIGRGGMGVVYRARQRSLDRVVAIKRMVFGPGSDPDLVKRFRAEAVSAAALRHPNIVAIHEVGVHEGQHFFVMDYVQGQSLAHLVTAGPLPARRAAGYLKILAEAVHYAHEHGILHRDLKPSNVLIDEQDQPRIVDFGLARRLEGASELTVTGQMLGSPHYLPPEQATAQRGRVSRRTDVYGLGATLYHVLTGRPPFQAESLAQVLDLVLHTDPVAPRLLDPTVPRDLETICLKCLEKEPARRYPTAQMLAEELGRFLEGQPIQARPLSPVGKTWRWCRRNPLTTSFAGAAVLLFLAGFLGVFGMWRQSEAQRRRAEAGEYVLAMNAAQAAIKADNPGRALELLEDHPPAASALSTLHSSLSTAFEWRYLWQQCQTDAEALVGRVSSRINSLEVSRDGRWLVAGSDAGAVKLWNLSTGEEISLLPDRGWPNYATFSVDSRLVVFSDQAIDSHGTVIAWDIQGRTRLAPVYKDPLPVATMSFSGDGRWLWIGAVNTNANAPTPNATSPAAPAPPGKRMVFLESPGWNKTRELSFISPQLYPNKGLYGVFTVDNRSVIYPETEPVRQLALYDFVAGTKPTYFPAHKEGITTMAISPDGRLLATGSGYSDTMIRLWEVPSLRSMGELTGHAAWISGLKFSRDGRTLVSASADRTIRFWSLTTKEATRIYRGMTAELSHLCLGPGDETVFSGGVDGTVFRWPAMAQPAPASRGRAHIKTGLKTVAVSPNCAEYAGIRSGSIHLGEVKPDTLPAPLPALGTNNTCLLFASQRPWLFSGTWDGTVQVWSLKDQRIQVSLRDTVEPVSWLGQDRQGRVLVALHRHRSALFKTPSAPHTVSVWNTANWHRQKAFTIPEIGSKYALSPDGNYLAAGDYAGNLQVWNLTGSRQISMLTFPGSVIAVTFSPDGKRLAAGTGEGTVRIWEVRGFHAPAQFRAESGALLALAYSPDAQRLVTAGVRAGSLLVWDVATLQQLITLENPSAISRALFSPEGNQLVGVSEAGEVLFWPVPSFAEIEAKEKAQKGQ